MNRFLRFPSLVTLVIRIAAVAIAIVCLVFIPPVLAQNKEAPTASILLDGRKLFEISQSGRYDAQERADEANYVLQQKIKTASPPVSVKIEESQNLPVIKVDGAHLLTVTQEDAPPGRSAKEQAEIWAGSLEKAIREAQEQRSSAYLRKAILLSIADIVLAIALSYGLSLLWHRWLEPKLTREMR